LEPPTWSLPREALAAAFSERTKLILFNTPMNPCSKVFDRAELEFIAALCLKHDAYAVCDEVYEHIIFDDRKHLSIMTLPGMRERTARIGSAGKSFSVTGWKVGYVTAPPEMMRAIAKTHQFMTFTTPPNLQWGAATGLRLGDAYYSTLAGDMQRKRDRLAEALAGIGFDGYAIGGLAIGEGQQEMFRILDFAPEMLPAERPRYLMGVGRPEDILGAVTRGIDMFDCVMPTRAGRTGAAFTRFGELNMRNARHAEDPAPIDPACACPACRDYSRGYIHHLVKSKEILGSMLLTWHNLHYYQELMAGLRAAIAAGSLAEFAASFWAERAKEAP
ncbi:MAG TPA: aminotransferase class I/II-fold pyridoxal phosphate-dependent enzyme, partial [Dongiaceae bacterium]